MNQSVPPGGEVSSITDRRDKPKKSRWKFGFRIFVAVVLFFGFTNLTNIVSFFSGVKTLKDQYHQDTTPPIILEEEAHFVKGILLPSNLRNSDNLDFEFGNSHFHYPISKLLAGQRILLGGDIPCDSLNTGLPSFILRIKNNRLYVTDSLIFFENKHVVGTVNEDSIELRRGEYYSSPGFSDTEFRVIDHQGCTMLYIAYIGNATVKLAGYFIGEKYSSVVSEDGDQLFCLPQNDPGYQNTIRQMARYHK